MRRRTLLLAPMYKLETLNAKINTDKKKWKKRKKKAGLRGANPA
jgi:hypothetical protein